MKTRRMAQPIFCIKKQEETSVPKSVIKDEAMDIVIMNVHEDDQVEEIQLDFKGNTNEYETPENFWAYIDKMGWKDRSELPNPSYRWDSKRNKTPNFQNFSVASLQSFKQHFYKYFNELKKVMEEKNIFESFERELTDFERTHLLSHIVAKGQVYYATILSEPYFCGALLSKNKSNDDFEDFTKHLN